MVILKYVKHQQLLLTKLQLGLPTRIKCHLLYIDLFDKHIYKVIHSYIIDVIRIDHFTSLNRKSKTSSQG